MERDLDGPMRATIKLVRYPARHGLRGRLSSHTGDGITLFERSFKPMLELDRLQTYAALLERVAQHANDGTLGCFVETESLDREVSIALYERWFDGDRLHCEQLASRKFDPDDENALVASAEFRGELEEWAERQNEAREADYLDAAADDAARRQRASERASAANDLARILARDAGR